MIYDVELAKAWSEFWDAILGAGGRDLTTAAAWIGLIIILGAVVVFMWRRIRGYSNEGSGPRGWIVWAIVFGAVLAAPDFIMPAILGLIDIIANTGVGLWDASRRN